MSQPVSAAEKQRAQHTLAQAKPTENLVSTACPQCRTRFVLLGRYDSAGWHLRCVHCRWHGTGELKEDPCGKD